MYGVSKLFAVILTIMTFAGTETVWAQGGGGTTIAWVNTQNILQQAPGYQEAESTYTAELAAFQAEVQRMQAQLDSAISDLDRTSVVLTPTARDEKESQIRALQQDLTVRGQELQLRVQQRERELVGPIEERVTSVIEGLRAERNIGIVLDVSAPGAGIVAADRALDLTPTVIQRLRASRP